MPKSQYGAEVDYATRDLLVPQFRALGVPEGGVVLLHSSYRSLGYVVGGPQAVIEALLLALGGDGTLVVPTHTSDNSDPRYWTNPPVPRHWWEAIRHASPGFDPARTPAGQYMGRLSELVRSWPGARRSSHPQVSFAAVGARAAEVTDEHLLEDGLGERSPLGAVYRLDGHVLLLGCGHDANTSLHLAETRQPMPPTITTGGSVRGSDGMGRWITWSEVDVDAGDFERLGGDFEKTNDVKVALIGRATARLMRQRAAVDFATKWIPSHRPDWAVQEQTPQAQEE
jgi:aminoglycoside 3-N-acetyltransferase